MTENIALTLQEVNTGRKTTWLKNCTWITRKELTNPVSMYIHGLLCFNTIGNVMFDSGTHSFQMGCAWFTVYKVVKRECRLVGKNSHDVCEMMGLVHTARLWGVYAHTPISQGVYDILNHGVRIMNDYNSMGSVCSHSGGVDANDKLYTVNLS